MVLDPIYWRSSVVVLLAACTPADSARDRSLYEAASQAGPAEGPALCAQIIDEALREECYAYDAAALAATDLAGAEARCATIQGQTWHSECLFLVADVGGAVGDDALRLCRRVLRHQRDCILHAIDRDVRGRTDLPLALGDEAALYGQIAGIIDTYAGFFEDPRGTPRSADPYAGLILADRWRDRPFDPVYCGEATRAQCATAYQMGVLASVGLDGIDASCGPDPLVARRTIADWTEAGAMVAAQGWVQVCDPFDGRDPSVPMAVPLRTPPDWNGHTRRPAPGRELHLRSKHP